MRRSPSHLRRRLIWSFATVVMTVVVSSLAYFNRNATSRTTRAPRSASGKSNKPNILILIGDDHAADTLGIEGDPHKATPRIDALARQGVYFRRAYCNSPLCTPSRQSLLTGRLPHAVGVTRLATPLAASSTTLGDWLGNSGYATAAFGKMHFNSAQKHGFQERIDTPQWEKTLKVHPPRRGDRRKPWHPMHEPAPNWLNAEGRSYGLLDESMEATFYVNRAAEFFRQHKDEPFAMVIGFYEPHSPFKFPDDWSHRYRPDEFPGFPISEADRRDMPKVFRKITPNQARGIEAAYFTSISYVDSKVGNVLDALEASGIADNTIVVYLGDNGYLRGQHGRFEKHCFYEPAVRVPLIIRWPNHLTAGRQVDSLVEYVDLLPTLLDLAGIDPPPQLHGTSLVPLADARRDAPGRRFVFSEYLENEEAMISDGRFKLIVGTGRRRRQDGLEDDDPTPGPYERLYDLATDPNEDANVAAEPKLAATKDRLIDAMFERLMTTQGPKNHTPRGLGRLETIHRCLVPPD